MSFLLLMVNIKNSSYYILSKVFVFSFFCTTKLNCHSCYNCASNNIFKGKITHLMCLSSSFAVFFSCSCIMSFVLSRKTQKLRTAMQLIVSLLLSALRMNYSYPWASTTSNTMWFFCLEMINYWVWSFLQFITRNWQLCHGHGSPAGLVQGPGFYFWLSAFHHLGRRKYICNDKGCLKSNRGKLQERKPEVGGSSRTNNQGHWPAGGSCLSGKGAFLFQVNHGNLEKMKINWLIKL